MLPSQQPGDNGTYRVWGADLPAGFELLGSVGLRLSFAGTRALVICAGFLSSGALNPRQNRRWWVFSQVDTEGNLRNKME